MWLRVSGLRGPVKNEPVYSFNNQETLIMDWVVGDTKEKFRMMVTQLCKERSRVLEMSTGLCSDVETRCLAFAMKSFRKQGKQTGQKSY